MTMLNLHGENTYPVVAAGQKLNYIPEDASKAWAGR